ncbi:Response regulator receiver domain-containing protein [Collimonas sp. OK307]|uniref:response regulator n=1 Tax=Collimonas sp. OK307 TaxID=1801620 RepID=UPI0008E0DA20|nr:response regulator [Collimonas sp. OK307]SFI41320.1 Response regulator receiver domain-containing protein [Collimonas sp. OK307]
MSHTTTPDAPSASVAPLRIFLVEDSVAVRDLMIDTLKEIPGVIFAGFAEEEADALKKIDAESFDVLILDIELKQGNGMSLLRTLAESHKPLNSLKIIFSNNVSNAFRRAGEKYGVRFFFDKSSEFTKLRDLLAALGTGLPDH